MSTTTTNKQTNTDIWRRIIWSRSQLKCSSTRRSCASCTSLNLLEIESFSWIGSLIIPRQVSVEEWHPTHRSHCFQRPRQPQALVPKQQQNQWQFADVARFIAQPPMAVGFDIHFLTITFTVTFTITFTITFTFSLQIGDFWASPRSKNLVV